MTWEISMSRVPIIATTLLVMPIFQLQAQSARTLVIDGRRPLAKAADTLQRTFGMLITYEDPNYLCEGDYDDMTAPDKKASEARALFPKAGRLEVQYTVSADDKNIENPMALLLQLIHDHANRGNPGAFDLSEDGGMYHLIPIQVRDEKGIMKPMPSMLDSIITIQASQRPIVDAVYEICGAISRATRSEVVVGAYPVNTLHQRRTTFGAVKRPAREVLMNVLRDAQKSIVWRLYWIAPGRAILNLAVPLMERTNIRGGKVLVEIPFPTKK